MCGRFTLATPAEEWADLFDVEPIETAPRYNVAPTEDVVVVRPRPGGAGREAIRMRWGLIPSWATSPDDVPLLINARRETLDGKPSFRDSYRDRRCLVIADGFYEWMNDAGGKRPFWIHLPSGAPFGFAAIWDRWDGGDGPMESCAIVTTDASPDLAPIHDRVPGVVEAEQAKAWLDGRTERRRLDALLASPEPGRFSVREVSRRVNRVQNDDPACIAPAAAQADLFS